MSYYSPCEACRKAPATTAHHMFEQYNWRKELYIDYIHDKRNLQYLCSKCHLNKLPGIRFMNEKEFCEVMGIKPRSKGSDYLL